MIEIDLNLKDLIVLKYLTSRAIGGYIEGMNRNSIDRADLIDEKLQELIDEARLDEDFERASLEDFDE